MAELKLYVGLMSGTSMDGVDAVLAGITNIGAKSLATHYLAYPADLRDELKRMLSAGPDELHRSARLANKLAALYAKAVNDLLAEANLGAPAIRAIGCHGQTVRHRPEEGYTLQLGNAALLAELTGIRVVADFRSRDIAAGGQGAPLVPAFHDAMFRSDSRHRVVLNLGGIANITNLRPDTLTQGFDCGPANLLLDAWIESRLGKPVDEAGSWAASGRVLPDLLERLLAHPYFALPPPKSCGHEQFNLDWLCAALTGKEQAADVQATLAALTARSVAAAVTRFCGQPDEVYACGGGVHNLAVMDGLKQALPDVMVMTTERLGIAPDWVEAIAFAWLAHRCIESTPGNLPEVTGARGPLILGAIYPA